MPKVEIFHSPLCGLCHEAMDYLERRGVPYEAHEVRWKGDTLMDSPEARDLLRRCGGSVDVVPQVFIDARRIDGWKTLSRLIATGEIDGLLGLPPGPDAATGA